jgi:hypothetical protein
MKLPLKPALLLLAANLISCTHLQLQEGPGAGENRPAEASLADSSAAAAVDSAGAKAEKLQDTQPAFRIIKEGRQHRENWLELNEYFLIHHLYTDIFQRFGLQVRFSVLDKIKIFAGVLYNLDYQTPVNLIIENFRDGSPLIVSLQLIQFGGQRSVLLATNTDQEGSALYRGAENLVRTYKRSYLIVGDQLITTSDLYSESKEAQLIAENSAEKLASFYIFDGNTGNDTVAEGLLIGSIREAGTSLERSLSELMLCRYYISQNRLREARALLLAVGGWLGQGGGDSNLLERYSATCEELLITGALKEHGAQVRENQPKSL